MTQTHLAPANFASDMARRYLLDYQSAFLRHDLRQAKSARACGAMAYVTHRKEDPLDFDALAMCVVLNIQRDLLCLPYRDPKYIHYSNTIAKMLSSSENLSHALYSVLFFHSKADNRALGNALERCEDLIHLYPQPVYSKIHLNSVLALLGKDRAAIQADFDNPEQAGTDLFALSLQFFKNDF